MLNCTKCRKNKIETDFHLKTKKVRGRQFQCKDCRKAYGRQWYAKNRDRLRKRAARRAKEIREWFARLKSSLACKQCGFNHPAALVFHHRDPTQKSQTVSNGAHQGGWSKSRILAEIAKCDVLCANCHRVLHFNLRDSSKVER